MSCESSFTSASESPATAASGLPTTNTLSSSPTTVSSNPPTPMPPVSQFRMRLRSSARVPPTEPLDSIDDDGKKRKHNQEDVSADGFRLVAKKAKHIHTSSEPKATATGAEKRKCSQRDIPMEGLRTSKRLKLKSTDKSLGPDLKEAKESKRKCGKEDISTQNSRSAKKSKLAVGSSESESETIGDSRGRCSQLNNSADDIRPTGNSKPTTRDTRHEEEAAAAKDELESTKRDLESTKKELESTKKELEKMKSRTSFAESYKVTLEYQLKRRAVQFLPDRNDLTAQFRDVGRCINILTYKKLVRVYHGDDIPEQVQKTLEQVSSTPFCMFLSNPNYGRVFIRAAIWRFLCTEFLENPFKLWGKGDEIGPALGKIQSGELGGDYDQLILWRAYTATLFYDRPVDETKLRTLKDSLMQLVKPFVLEENKDKIDTQVEPYVDEILNNAIILARHLNRYEDKMEITRKAPSDANDTSQSYDDEWMNICRPSVGTCRTVELLISPALIQRGIPIGSDVEQAWVLQKADVGYRRGYDEIPENQTYGGSSKALTSPRGNLGGDMKW
ncbi:hypothetical protein F5Y04DRAFT_280398 [Hypomontagnella monticulosa]|nr:hypothetical protein F5Y04DRAFT_280398 [Hypomontagnella monticulosa]